MVLFPLQERRSETTHLAVTFDMIAHFSLSHVKYCGQELEQGAALAAATSTRIIKTHAHYQKCDMKKVSL
jgi:hypothetical protein